MFQFTHPGRGATTQYRQKESDVFVSIHAPREGCDHEGASDVVKLDKFQFTHPGRGATCTTEKFILNSEGFNSRTPGGVRQLRGVR